MELCPGGDLQSYVRKRRKLTDIQCKFIFKQIIEAIQYLHRNLIVHRDIKLENILLDGSGRIKIGDFGVSKQLKSPNELLREQCGTRIYIAPEITNRQPYLGPPVDVWASGICLYSMLLGKLPDTKHSQVKLSDTKLSQSAKDLLGQILNPNPIERITTHEILSHEWFKDTPQDLDIFDEQEKDLMRQEFTVQKATTEDVVLNTDFTEFSISSQPSVKDLKNNTTESLIFSPFNSIQKQEEIDHVEVSRHLSQFLLDRKTIKWGQLVRAVNREYEKNNNLDFDNGVYHKFAYKHQPEVERARQNEISKNRQVIFSLEEVYESINENLVREMVRKYKCWSAQFIQECLKSKQTNHCTATYFLI
jgi:serine/threonine protein kinase